MAPFGKKSTTTHDWLAKRRRLDALLRLQAAMLLGEPGVNEAVRVFAEALADPDTEVRETAAGALGDLGDEAAGALSELLAAAGDDSAVVRRRVVRALGTLGRQSDDAISALIAATDDPDPGVSLQAVAALGDVGPSAAMALPALMAVFWTGDSRGRAVAGVALARVGAAAVPSLNQSLRHPSPDVRCKAAQVLARIGPDASVAIPALEKLAQSTDEGLRQAASEALKMIGARP